MAEAGLSQAEVWDDSALVKSWNEAFEEYKKYHSLAVKGEKVDISAKGPAVNGDTPPDATTKQATTSRGEQSSDDQTTAGAPAAAAPVMPALPQVLAATVQNEDMKNLMMSWYYAGYYTGLYEGKQQGYAMAVEEGRQNG